MLLKINLHKFNYAPTSFPCNPNLVYNVSYWGVSVSAYILQSWESTSAESCPFTDFCVECCKTQFKNIYNHHPQSGAFKWNLKVTLFISLHNIYGHFYFKKRKKKTDFHHSFLSRLSISIKYLKIKIFGNTKTIL